MAYKPIYLFLSTLLLLTGAVAQAQVTPGSVTLGPSQQQQFSVAEGRAIWGVEPAGAGLVSANGLYTAPATYSGTYAYVYAQVGPFSYSAQVNLIPSAVASAGFGVGPSVPTPVPTPPSVAISMSPSTIYLSAGQSEQFYATVTGTSNAQVIWSLLGQGSLSGGLYTAPPTVNMSTLVTVQATSVADPNLTANATIVLQGAAPAAPTVSLSLTPPSASLTAGQSQQFTATVSGTLNAGVYWSLSPSIGTVAYGLYTAPATIGTAQSITITATSAQDASVIASATINLAPSPAATPTVSIGLAPTTASVSAGQSQQFTASVSGTTNTAVTWSLVPNVGTIVKGVYTAPATVSSQQTVTVVATSVADSTKVASAAVQLQPASAGGTFAPIDVRSGGGQYVDAQGVVWAADYGYSGTSSTFSTSNPIGGTTSDALYQDERWGQNFEYSFPVPNGNYKVTLKFSENFFSNAGARVFNVVINNQPVLTNFDIFAQAGAEYQALDESFSIPVSNGLITIQFSGVVQNGKIDAIQISQTSQTNSSPANVGISLSPASVTLTTGGGSTQFGAIVTGSSNTAVTWSLSPSVGGIVNGLYTAPATITSSQGITITATSAANPAKSATATVSLVAPIAPITGPVLPTSVSPATATVAPSGAQQFSVQNLPSGTSVNWAVSPATGSVNQSGIYLAPGSVATQQTLTITARNSSTQAVLGTASLTLQASPPPAAPTSVSPATATIAPSGAQQFSVQNLPSGTSVTWAVSPATGSVTQSGVYTAPSSVATQTTVTVTARNSSTQAVLGTASLTLQASPPPAPAVVVLPVEVMGATPTTVPVTFTIPSGSNLTGQLQLWLQIHGLEYQSQASVQVNGGTWLPINDTTATYLGQANTFGGLGGGFSTLTLTMNLPGGSIQQGQNTLTFRFNGTDGNSSGFRVLNLNVLASNGSQLIPAATFTQDDPSSWTPPLNDAADIQAGQTLYQTANLISPLAGGAIQAKCGSCHTQDGRDLKYFNYSNLAIETRAVFHGLTAQQGAQIASYIRTLNAPASVYAAPWNPPYQPGPGMDSRAVSDWAAGAGLSAVLDQDSDTLQYLMPGGSTATWAANAYLNAREIPIQIQLPDWNHWLPRIHPLDAWGSSFTSSSWYQLYLTVRSQLVPNNAAVDVQVIYGPWQNWIPDEAAFVKPGGVVPASMSEPAYQAKYYSTALWGVTKFWELEQQFGLEGMAQAIYGPNTQTDRAWFANAPFHTGPGISGLPTPSAIGNGLAVTTEYASFGWYQLQLILNDGNGNSDIIDWPYALGYPTNNLTWNPWALPDGAPRVGTAGFLTEWIVKALQIDDLNSAQSPTQFVDFPGQVSWSINVSATQKVQIINDYLTVWFAKFGAMTQAQFFALPMNTPSSSNPAQMEFGQYLINALPQLRYQGADSTLLNQIATWAATIWPSYNWIGDLNATCAVSNAATGQVACK
jgi:hypothetical protein